MHGSSSIYVKVLHFRKKPSFFFFFFFFFPKINTKNIMVPGEEVKSFKKSYADRRSDIAGRP